MLKKLYCLSLYRENPSRSMDRKRSTEKEESALIFLKKQQVHQDQLGQRLLMLLALGMCMSFCVI